MSDDKNKIHPFQMTLGLGPYKLVGFFALQLPNESNQGRNNFAEAPKVERGIGTCAHCSHAITNIYIVEIADGKRFGVGCDCIEKCGLPYAELTKVQKIQREQKRMQRAALKAKKGNAAREALQYLILERGDEMRQLKHPKRNDGSLLDYANWLVKRSSDGGIVFALRNIKKELENIT